jgi:hypothetical protein
MMKSQCGTTSTIERYCGLQKAVKYCGILKTELGQESAFGSVPRTAGGAEAIDCVLGDDELPHIHPATP